MLVTPSVGATERAAVHLLRDQPPHLAGAAVEVRAWVQGDFSPTVFGVEILSPLLRLNPAPFAIAGDELPQLTVVRRVQARVKSDLGIDFGGAYARVEESPAVLEFEPAPSAAGCNQLPQLTSTIVIIRRGAQDDPVSAVVRIQKESTVLQLQAIVGGGSRRL